MTRTRVVGVAVAALALVAGASGCGISLQSLPKISGQSGPFYHLHATFSDVLNLPAEAEVRAGVATVGQVSSISTSNFHANVTLDIKTKVKLPVGTTAQVRFDSPLGDEYVLLTVPQGASSRGDLRNGATITETSSAPSIEDSLAALSTVLTNGGISQVATITQNLNKAFSGNQPQVRDLLTQLNRAVTSLSSHSGDIDAALSALQALSTQLNGGSGTIVAAIDNLGPALSVLAGENGNFANLLTSVNNLSGVANNVLAASGEQFATDLNLLAPVVNQLVSVQSQLGTDLGALSTFEKTTPKVAPGNYLQVSLNATAHFLPGSAAPATASTATAASVAHDPFAQLALGGVG